MASVFDWLRRLFGGGQKKPANASITLDAGHGGRFSGAAVQDPDNPNEEVLEKDLNLQIVLFARDMLEQKGYTVVLTRDSDTQFADDLNADLRQRAEIANRAGTEIFISLHCNSSENAQATGYEIYHHPNSERGKALAAAIHASFVQGLPARPDRGIKTENFAVLRLTSMPACLIEAEFMTNRDGLRILTSATGQQAIARALTAGVEKYFAG